MWAGLRGGAHKLTSERTKRLVRVLVPACHFVRGHTTPLFINEQSSGDAQPPCFCASLIDHWWAWAFLDPGSCVWFLTFWREWLIYPLKDIGLCVVTSSSVCQTLDFQMSSTGPKHSYLSFPGVCSWTECNRISS